jgi:DNA-directed RNA polymerase specialized sigma24 family protein
MLLLQFRVSVDHYRKRKENMDRQSVTGWIDQLANGNSQAAEHLWQHVCAQLQEFARQKLDVQTRRRYDENDAANSAFHSLCRGLADGRIEAENRDALWGLLAVITSRKISAQRRYFNRQKRGGGDERGESGFGEAGINAVSGNQVTPDVLAEVSESCAQLLDAISDESMKKIVLLKFQGATNGEVASELNCTRRTIERKLERIRRIWVEAGLHCLEE